MSTDFKKAATEVEMNTRENSQGSENIVLQIEGMSCGCEGTMIEKKMKALAGVRSHELNTITSQLNVVPPQSEMDFQAA